MPKCVPPARSLPEDASACVPLSSLCSAAAAGCRDSSAGGDAATTRATDGTDSAARRRGPEAYLPGRRPGRRRVPAQFLRPAQVVGDARPDRVSAVWRRFAVRPGPDLHGRRGLASGDALPAVVQSTQAGRAGVRRRLLEGRRQRACAARTTRCASPAPAAAARRSARTLCRNDADCPSRRGCLEYPQPLPNNSARDGRRMHAGDEDRRHGLHGARAPVRRGRGACSTARAPAVRDCKAGGTKSPGRSLHRGRRVPQRRVLRPQLQRQRRRQPRATARASAHVNSDCGPDQRCVRLVVGNNGTIDDPLDDVVVGYCRTLFVPTDQRGAARTSAECVDPGQRRGHLRPDARHLLQGGRGHGGPCAADGALRPGPDLRARAALRGRRLRAAAARPAGATGVDACPGRAARSAASAASDEPLYRCYEGCATAGGVLAPARTTTSARPRRPAADQHLPVEVTWSMRTLTCRLGAVRSCPALAAPALPHVEPAPPSAPARADDSPPAPRPRRRR